MPDDQGGYQDGIGGGLEKLLNGAGDLIKFSKYIRKVTDGGRVLPSLHNLKVVCTFYKFYS